MLVAVLQRLPEHPRPVDLDQREGVLSHAAEWQKFQTYGVDTFTMSPYLASFS
jgi:hypothetical protein